MKESLKTSTQTLCRNPGMRPTTPSTGQKRRTKPLLNTLTSALALALLLLACSSSSQLNANAGTDNSVTVGTAPHFNGCESEGKIANYEWAVVDTPPGNQQDLNKMIRATDTGCSFTLEADMQIEEIGTWIIELTITADNGASDTDQVTVTVTT